MLKSQEIFERKGLGGSSHGSTITEDRNGTLYCVWYSGTKEKAADVKIYMSKKKKNEEEWSKPILIEKEGITSENPFAEDMEDGETEETSEGNPVIFADPNSDRIWLFWATMRGAGDKSGWSACILKVKHSDDGGNTWTKPRVIRDMIGWMVRNKPIVLSNGDVLLPIMSEVGQAKTMMYRITKDEFAKGSQICKIMDPMHFIDGGVIQGSLAEIEPGKLLCYMRATSGCSIGNYIAVSYSSDYGYSWTPIERNPSNIENPDSGVDLVKAQNGDLYLVCNPQADGRYRLSIFRSTDKGKNWQLFQDLENDASRKSEFSYPAIIEGKDGSLHITYTNLRENIKYVMISNPSL
jgi:predicted neuraminidase